MIAAWVQSLPEMPSLWQWFFSRKMAYEVKIVAEAKKCFTLRGGRGSHSSSIQSPPLPAMSSVKPTYDLQTATPRSVLQASALLKANADIVKRLFVVERNDNGQDKRCEPSRNLNLWSEAVCQTQ
jgi:hypothetical protein